MPVGVPVEGIGLGPLRSLPVSPISRSKISVHRSSSTSLMPWRPVRILNSRSVATKSCPSACEPGAGGSTAEVTDVSRPTNLPVSCTNCASNERQRRSASGGTLFERTGVVSGNSASHTAGSTGSRIGVHGMEPVSSRSSTVKDSRTAFAQCGKTAKSDRIASEPVSPASFGVMNTETWNPSVLRAE